MVDEETRRGVKQSCGRESVVELSSSSSSSNICQLLMIHMTGGAPFGFRIASTRANGFSPFVISMIRMNGKAYRSGLKESDFVLAINGFSCCSLITHQSATKLMEYDDPELTLHVLRGENVCDDSIRSSLQSLDSQILVLTDEEIQSVIAKKLSNQQLKLHVSRSPYVNSPSPQLASPFRLQPPSQARGKLADRRKDRRVAFQQEHNDAMSYFSYDGFNEKKNTNSDDYSTETTSCKDITNEQKSSFINDSDRSNEEHKLNTLEYRKNDNDAQSHLYRFQDQLNSQTISKSGIAIGARPSETTLSQASPAISTERTNETHGITETVEINENQADSELKMQLCDMQKQNQDPIKREDNFRSRYRVEQKFEFKPLQQSRYYDADSGQFTEKKTTIPRKRRSNSISSCYMYINPSGIKSSLSTEDSRSLDCESKNSQEAHFKQGTCTDRTTPFLAPVKQVPILKLPRSPLAHIQYNTLSNVTFNTGLENVSSKDFPQIPNLEHVDSSVHYPAALANDGYSGSPPSLGPKEVADYLKTCLNRSFQKNNQFSMAGETSSALYSQHSGPHNDKIDSRLIRSRLSAVTAANKMTNAPASSSNYVNQSKELTSRRSYRYPEYYSDGGEWNTPLEYMHSSSNKVNRHGPTQESGQNITDDEFCRSTTRMRPNSTTKPHRQDLNESIAINEGRGGRLFARRRANSDAWIIGERPPVDTLQATSGVDDSGTFYSLPRHRRSSLANRHHNSIETTQTASPEYKRDCMETPFIRSDSHQPYEATPTAVFPYSSVPMRQSFGRQTMNLSPKTPKSLVREQVNLKSSGQGLSQKQLNFRENIGYSDL